jgi:probable rRNA maturation factor
MKLFEAHVTNRQKTLKADAARLRRTARHVLRDRGVTSARVSIVLLDDAAIAPLKQQYYGLAEATDVLSFDLADEPDEPHESDAPDLDLEILLNAQRADRIAHERGHQPLAELDLYLVHGLLHHLGFDDHDPADARKMHHHEDRLLTELGVGAVYQNRNPQR